MKIFGQHFTSAIIDNINSLVERVPDISRRVLSRQVCEWLDWRTTNDKWQDGSCRKALLRLVQLDKIKLPELVSPFITGTPKPAARIAVDDVHIRCKIAGLGEIEFLQVGDRRSKLAKIWKAMLDEHHYLGSGPLCGAQLKYVIKSEKVGYIGALAFSSASYAMNTRDDYIGWSEDARRANLNRVVTNSRFLLLPGVKVNNLPSHLLSKALKRIAGDWQTKYHVRPVLVETFVDGSKFNGTCYQAANWHHIGQTAGRRDGQCKKIYLYFLKRDWCDILCQEPAVVLGQLPPPETTNWAEAEFGSLRVQDNRLKRRLYTIADDFFNRPLANIPEASGSKAKAMGAYRFFQNKKVTMDVILTPHTESTIRRIQQHSVVLAPQDTSTLTYCTHKGTTGFGPINNKANTSVGLMLHDTLAFTEEGTPLGVLDAQCWARKEEEKGKSEKRKILPIEEKESYKWLKSYQKLCEIQALCPETTLVSIGDRESDIYELFMETTKTENTAELLVRSDRARNRKVENEDLWLHMKAQPLKSELRLQLPKRGNESAREAHLELRFSAVTLASPKSKKLPTITVWVVYLVEINPPSDIEPIEWLLITTVEVNDIAQASRVINWYSKRWGIEVYHRTLKSGCRIKDRHLDTADRIQTCLGVDMVVAWRVFYLTMLGREVPDSPCSIFFEEMEWKALYCYQHRTPFAPEEPPTLEEAVKMVGLVGGHMGRKQDGMPGTDCIWRGLQRLDPVVDMYAIMRHLLPPQSRQSYPHSLTDCGDGP